MDEEKKVIPVYKWVEEEVKEGEEGEEVEELTPIRRKIAKTMEVTEHFTYYDALEYCMKMEKAVEDKKAEIDSLETMIKAYREEIEMIEKALKVTAMEEEWNLELHKKLKAEKEAASEEKLDEVINELTEKE